MTFWAKLFLSLVVSLIFSFAVSNPSFAGDRGLWVWSMADRIVVEPEQRALFYEFIDAPHGEVDHRINIIYMSISEKLLTENPAAVRQFLEEAHAHGKNDLTGEGGLTVEFLTGDPLWAIIDCEDDKPDCEDPAMDILNAVLSFNLASMTPEQRFDRFQQDTEPYVLDRNSGHPFSWGIESDRNIIWQRYMNNVKKWQARVNEHNGASKQHEDLALGVVIPSWWDPAGNEPANHRLVQDEVDYVIILNYDTRLQPDSDNPEVEPRNYIRNIQSELSYGRAIDRPVYVGFETLEPQRKERVPGFFKTLYPNSTSYYYLGSRFRIDDEPGSRFLLANEVMEKHTDEVLETFGDNPAFAGMAYHYYEDIDNGEVSYRALDLKDQAPLVYPQDPMDLDHDGVFNAEDEDADGDGVKNDEEKLQGSDPFDPTSIPDGLVLAYWNFDKQTFDSSLMTGPSLQTVGTPAEFELGDASGDDGGYSLRLPNNQDRPASLDLAFGEDQVSISETVQALTVEMKIKPEAKQEIDFIPLYFQGDIDKGLSLILKNGGDFLSLRAYNEPAENAAMGGFVGISAQNNSLFSKNGNNHAEAWHHVAFTYNGVDQTIKLYVDHKLVAQTKNARIPKQLPNINVKPVPDAAVEPVRFFSAQSNWDSDNGNGAILNKNSGQFENTLFESGGNWANNTRYAGLVDNIKITQAALPPELLGIGPSDPEPNKRPGTLFSLGLSESVRSPQITGDRNGNLYAAWIHSSPINSLFSSNRYVVKFSKSQDQGETWSAPRPLGHSITTSGGRLIIVLPGQLTMCANAQGRIYVARLLHSGAVALDYSLDFGETWQEQAIQISAGQGLAKRLAANLKLLCDESDRLSISWWQQGTVQTVFSADQGQTWTSPEPAPFAYVPVFGASFRNSLGFQSTYDMIADAEGRLLLVWVGTDQPWTWNTSASDYSIYARIRDPLGSWGQKITVSSKLAAPDLSVTGLHIAKDQGNVHLVWATGPDRKEDIFVTRSLDFGRTWPTPATRANTNLAQESRSIAPSITTDGKNHVYVTWLDQRNSPQECKETIRCGKGNRIQQVFSRISSDRGQTWRSRDVEIPGALEPMAQHTLLHAHDSGTIYASIDNASYNQSADFGENWLAAGIEKQLQTERPWSQQFLDQHSFMDVEGTVHLIGTDPKTRDFRYQRLMEDRQRASGEAPIAKLSTPGQLNRLDRLGTNDFLLRIIKHFRLMWL